MLSAALRPRAVGPVALLVMALLPLAPARAGEAYYLVLFASQKRPNDPDRAHTFATFVRASWPGDGPCPPSARLETHTISWLPRTLDIHTFTGRPEPGHNFDLAETLRFVTRHGAEISAWGPYRIQPELYCQALRQITFLESGCVLYKANDMMHHSDHVSNCIHAVGAVAEGHCLHWGSPGWGCAATRAVLRKLRPWIPDPCQTYPWVAHALGLDEYPVRYRDREARRGGHGSSCGPRPGAAPGSEQP